MLSSTPSNTKKRVRWIDSNDDDDGYASDDEDETSEADDKEQEQKLGQHRLFQSFIRNEHHKRHKPCFGIS